MQTFCRCCQFAGSWRVAFVNSRGGGWGALQHVLVTIFQALNHKNRAIVTRSLLQVRQGGSISRTMRRVTIAAVAALSLVAGGAAAVWGVDAKRKASSASASQIRRHVETAVQLEFRDLLDPGPKLKPSEKALALNGQRVRLVGFMAEMELPIEGGFYLVPRPLSMDEAGGGTADLPLESVLVLVPSMQGKTIAPIKGALEGIGIFEVGNRSDEQGRVSNFRLKLDLAAGVGSSHAADELAKLR